MAWDTDQLEVFDAVDEIKEDFYNLLQLTRDANLNEIKKSFRKLSLTLHPDKSESPTAERDFRNLVTVYDILRNPEKRRHYDHVLEHGLPNWGDAVFYYRRVRKMGLQEMFLILLLAISVGQYIVSWAVYFEDTYKMEGVRSLKEKKLSKKKREKNENLKVDEYAVAVIRKPSILNTLPFQLCSCIKNLVVSLFFIAINKFNHWSVTNTTTKEKPKPRTENTNRSNPKPKKGVRKPEILEAKLESENSLASKTSITDLGSANKPILRGGLWTDDDFCMLAKLINKYPSGEQDRWLKISETMNRTVQEVTHMANKLKENAFKLPTENEQDVLIEEHKKIKTKNGKTNLKESNEEENMNSSVWSQYQQKALETALIKFSKKSMDNRWERIASCVPGKTKEECILRYKKIVSAICERNSSQSNGIEGKSYDHINVENEEK